jgi:hypothetical protein
MDNNGIISKKLENLMQGIHDQYGALLTDELIARLETTIADFNEEVDFLMSELKENATLKEKLMADIKSGKNDKNEKNDEPKEDSAEEVKEASEWEKRLEALN